MYSLVSTLTSSIWIHYYIYKKRFKNLHLMVFVSGLLSHPDAPSYAFAISSAYLIEYLIKHRESLLIAFNRALGYCGIVQSIRSIPILKNTSQIPMKP